MIYDAKNANGSQVFCLDPVQRINRVVSIDTERGTLQQLTDPVRLGPDGNVFTVTRQFAAIWTISDPGYGFPVLFHCYGEKPAAA